MGNAVLPRMNVDSVIDMLSDIDPQACKRRQEMANLLEARRLEAIRLDKERRAKAEAARRRGLLRMARDLRHASEIRALVATVVNTKGAEPTQARNIATWVEWALAVADRTDPIGRLEFGEDGRAILAEPKLPDPE